MSEPGAASLARAREELRAARVLLDADLPSQAVSRAYLAGLNAAGATLEVLDTLPPTRGGVVSAYGRRAVEEHGLGHEAGRRLRRLLEHRNDVDHGLADAPPATARSAIEDAEHLVLVTERWLERRLIRS